MIKIVHHSCSDLQMKTLQFNRENTECIIIDFVLEERTSSFPVESLVIRFSS